MQHVLQAPAPPTADPATSLGKAVYDALASQDLGVATRFLASFVSIPGNASVQMIQMNRYWRRQLDSLDVDTIAVREYLLDDCAAVDWMRHFRRGVMPVVLAYGLPIL